VFSHGEGVLIGVPRPVADSLKLVIHSGHGLVSGVHLDVAVDGVVFLLHVAGSFRALVGVVIAVSVDQVGVQARSVGIVLPAGLTEGLL